MGEVKRYEHNWREQYMEEYSDGEYVLSSDYDILKAENIKLRDALEYALKGCPTKAKGCTCVKNKIQMALGEPTQQALKEQS